MKLLLDTHVFLWFIGGDTRLPIGLRQAILNPANDIFVSVVSVWESVIKHAVGKLPFPESPDIYLPKQRENEGFESLMIDEASVAELALLPPLHRDPFDRMLVAQAIQHGMKLASVDPMLQGYPVPLLMG